MALEPKLIALTHSLNEVPADLCRPSLKPTLNQLCLKTKRRDFGFPSDVSARHLKQVKRSVPAREKVTGTCEPPVQGTVFAYSAAASLCSWEHFSHLQAFGPPSPPQKPPNWDSPFALTLNVAAGITGALNY